MPAPIDYFSNWLDGQSLPSRSPSPAQLSSCAPSDNCSIHTTDEFPSLWHHQDPMPIYLPVEHATPNCCLRHQNEDKVDRQDSISLAQTLVEKAYEGHYWTQEATSKHQDSSKVPLAPHEVPDSHGTGLDNITPKEKVKPIWDEANVQKAQNLGPGMRDPSGTTVVIWQEIADHSQTHQDNWQAIEDSYSIALPVKSRARRQRDREQHTNTPASEVPARTMESRSHSKLSSNATQAIPKPEIGTCINIIQECLPAKNVQTPHHQDRPNCAHNIRGPVNPTAQPIASNSNVSRCLLPSLPQIHDNPIKVTHIRRAPVVINRQNQPVRVIQVDSSVFGADVVHQGVRTRSDTHQDRTIPTLGGAKGVTGDPIPHTNCRQHSHEGFQKLLQFR